METIFKIHQLIYNHIPMTSKQSGGWSMFNAPCCHHRGETPDTRGRMGLRINSDNSLAFNCFNCNFKTVISPYKPLSNTNKQFLKWLGLSKENINEIVLEILKIKDTHIEIPITIHKNLISTLNEKCNLPYNTKYLKDILLDDNPDSDAVEVAEYIVNRNIKLFDIIPFMWSNEDTHKMKHRFIIPFVQNNEIVGYTARIIDKYFSKKIGKYHHHMPKNFIFNVDILTETHRKYVFITEGVIDAMIINGISTMTKSVTDAQESILNSYKNIEKIIIPDRDETGYSLIEYAKKNGWSVSFPDIFINDEDKDIDNLFINHNRIFIIERILANIERNPIKIDLKWKQWKIKKEKEKRF